MIEETIVKMFTNKGKELYDYLVNIDDNSFIKVINSVIDNIDIYNKIKHLYNNYLDELSKIIKLACLSIINRYNRKLSIDDYKILIDNGYKCNKYIIIDDEKLFNLFIENN